MTFRPILRLASWARLVLGLCLLIGLCAVTGSLAAPRAHAQTTLTITDCSSDAQLQAAVAQANSDNAGDTITFACSGDIKLSATLTISGSMTLDGSGQQVTLDGGNTTQVLVVNGVSFTLKALTIAQGIDFFGGGLYNNGGTVSISASTFSGNSAFFGGGLDNENGGMVSISRSTFSGNSADGGGGGLENGFFSGSGTVTISNSTFSGNSAPNVGSIGGGLLNSGTAVSISASTFSGNSADGGGGIGSVAGTVSISGSTFTNNSATGTDNLNGGGLLNGFSSTVNITNSTFSGNTSAERGGGLHNGGGSTMTITNSTFSGNSAPSGGGLSNDGTVTIGGSIVAANTGGDCNQLATLTDQGYNLESGTSCGFTSTTSKRNTDPKLGPLASNGGPTQTMALLKGSPAIDYIPLSLCPTTDQRGHKRPDNVKESACDIGAYES